MDYSSLKGVLRAGRKGTAINEIFGNEGSFSLPPRSTPTNLSFSFSFLLLFRHERRALGMVSYGRMYLGHHSVPPA